MSSRSSWPVDKSSAKYLLAETVTWFHVFNPYHNMVIFRIINIRFWCVLYFFLTTQQRTLRHTMLQLAVTHQSLTHAESPSPGTYHSISLNYLENLYHKIAFARSISKKQPQKSLHSATYAAENCSHAGSASKFAEHCRGMKCTTKTETDAKSNLCQCPGRPLSCTLSHH